MKKAGREDLYDSTFIRKLMPGRVRRGPLAAALGTFVVVVFLILNGQGYLRFGLRNLDNYEAGMVATRDVIAGKTVFWVDQAATAELTAGRRRQMPAVFTYSTPITAAVRNTWDEFAAWYLAASGGEALPDRPWAAYLSPEVLSALLREPDRRGTVDRGGAVLEYLLETGIFALPESGLDEFSQERVQLWHNYGPRTERELVSFDRIITPDRVREIITRYSRENGYSASFSAIAPLLIAPFVEANVFFSPSDTENYLAEQHFRVEPVMRHIERGKKVIRRGFVITEAELEELAALRAASGGIDIRGILGKFFILLLAFGFLVFLTGERTLGRRLRPGEAYLFAAMTLLYLAGAFFLKSFSSADDFPVAVFLPTALMVMIPALLISFRAAFAVAITLPLTAFLSGAFDTAGYLFALSSAVFAAWTLRSAERRLDLLKAGIVVSAANTLTSGALSLLYRNSAFPWYVIVISSAINGMVSAMLTLGLLPALEHCMNAVTNFRLIELADLNTPILKRLFDAAPGTYSHSIMVANLAENACQAIGANPLLARVGAYYHDLGKMDNPSYFVENQTQYNRHTEMNNPRLSATVIRSHVKLGVEKARSLGLPQAVIDIVAEHHGNGLITWFYAQALEKEKNVNKEDFSYPGNPPRSKESAVVMLADVTEAACRTLKKPTASRLEKFISELIMSKFEHSQLSDSDLTFRELETIKKAFVRVLAGYYHSRIEYPTIHETQNGDSVEDSGAGRADAGNGAGEGTEGGTGRADTGHGDTGENAGNGGAHPGSGQRSGEGADRGGFGYQGEATGRRGRQAEGADRRGGRPDRRGGGPGRQGEGPERRTGDPDRRGAGFDRRNGEHQGGAHQSGRHGDAGHGDQSGGQAEAQA